MDDPPVDPTDANLARAAQVFLHSPLSRTSFSISDAMVLIGIPGDVAKTQYYIDKVEKLIKGATQGNTITFDQSAEGKVKRVATLVRVFLPKVPGLASVMELAGIPQPERTKTKPQKGPTALYMRCKIQRDKILKGNEDLETQQAAWISPLRNPCIPQVLTIDSIETERDAEHDILSPLSASGVSRGPSLASSSGSSSESSSAELLTIPTRRERQQNANSSITSITSGGTSRHTASQQQEERVIEQQIWEMKKCAVKLGTILYQQVLAKENPVCHLQGSNKCADAINQMFKRVLVSGHQLSSGVRENRVGKSPPRPGRPSEIPDDDFKGLCALFWTVAAIEQANSDPQRLNRVEETSLLGTIVNAKRRAEGKNNLDEISLYERIQTANSTNQGVQNVDDRDVLRVRWLTYSNQRNSYLAWEKVSVEEGFARLPTDERERQEKGYVVFYPKQERRFCNFDEMKFTLDGKDEKAGGRPAVSHTTSTVPEAGKASVTSDNVCTITMGIIGNEPMPFLVIFPSKAKEDNYKIKIKRIASFKPIVAQYGYESPQTWDCTFAVSPKGSMNGPILTEWVNEHVIECWPDLCDLPGYRVLLKADSGPGRTAADFLARAHIEGVKFFPGVPNGTEVGQEMDQLFGAFKASCYRNRTKLLNARIQRRADNARLTHNDVGFLIFGGICIMDDGTEVELEEAFSLYFSTEHIRAAREKCGYCPATRNGLLSDRVRHEAIETLAGDFDEEEDTYGALLDQLEAQNHSAVESLESKGYELASKGKRYVHRVTSSQVAGRQVRTEPNTRERQDLLQKCVTAGNFFEVTGGGGVANNADMLLAKERKEMLQEVPTKEKTKKNLIEYSVIRSKARTVYDKSFSKWQKGDFVLACKYKTGPFPPKGLAISGMKKSQLSAFYNNKYKGRRRQRKWKGWTRKNEAELVRFKSGQINSVQETAIYGRALETQNIYLATKFRYMSKTRRKQVLGKLFEELPADEKDDIARLLAGAPEIVSDSDEPETDDGSKGDSGDESSLMTFETDDENNSMSDRLDPILRELESGKDSDSISDLLAAGFFAASESESESASKEGSPPHNAGRSTTAACESQESDVESSEASFMTPPDIEEENENEATGWCNDNDNDNDNDNNHSESKEVKRLRTLSRIESLEKKKERQAGDDNQFPTKLAEADRRLRLRKDLRIKDLEVLFEARGEECQPFKKDRKKKILEQWELVKCLPVVWEPWTEANNKELEELMCIIAGMDD
jgi:hypothetical protein